MDQKQSDAASDLAKDTAFIAVNMYAALLNAEIPPNPDGVTHFTREQAFKLLNTVFYEALKDSDLA